MDADLRVKLDFLKEWLGTVFIWWLVHRMGMPESDTAAFFATLSAMYHRLVFKSWPTLTLVLGWPVLTMIVRPKRGKNQIVKCWNAHMNQKDRRSVEGVKNRGKASNQKTLTFVLQGAL